MWEKPFVSLTGILQALYNSHMSLSLLRQGDNLHSLHIWIEKLPGMKKENSVVLRCNEPFSSSQLHKPFSSSLQRAILFLAHTFFFCTHFSPCTELLRVFTWSSALDLYQWVRSNLLLPPVAVWRWKRNTKHPPKPCNALSLFIRHLQRKKKCLKA